jgi:putative transposase
MIELREGKEAARKAERLQRGHMPGVSPLDFVEIDHAMLDIFVVDDRCCLPLGRPWVTVMVDRSSGVVLGIYVSFYGACLHSIYGCLRHSLWPHPQIRELWPDIENDWVSWGRGTYYVSDRGADFLSPRYRHAIRMMGGFTEYCEARTPWHKPSIERFMGTMSSLFETMPGKAFSSIDLRGDYDPIKHSVVRFTSLVYLLHKWVADSHNVSAKSSRQARRIDIWNDGMENAPLIIPREPEKIDVALGDWYDGSLRHDGIRHKYLNYANSEMLREVLKRHGEGCNVKFVVNRSNRGSIHVQDPDSLALFRVPALRQDYAEGLTDFQHDYFRKELGDKLKPATAIDQLISVQRSIRDTLASDLIARENSQKVKLARIADINSSSVLARETRSILDLVKEPELAPPPALIIPPSFTEVPKITWGV